ncbi:hypothetical protein KF840_25345 [bacterium]|nr:hypothetical protein [bacterium]
MRAVAAAGNAINSSLTTPRDSCERPLAPDVKTMRNRRRWLALAGALTLCAAWRAQAFEHQEYRAADGTTYQVLRSVGPLGGGAERERITTLAGSQSGSGGCNLSTTMASAVVGVIPPGQSLHPFGSIRRTAILLPNDITALAFDPTHSGRVTIGTGGSALKVCQSAADCGGGATNLVGLATADMDVPAACIANGLQADCESNTRQAFAFGLAATGNPPVCQVGPTVNTSICAAEPSDGFALSPGQAIVFVFSGSLGSVGFGVGAAGFGIDANASGSVCMSGGVVSATSPSQSLPAPGQPRTRERAPAASALGLAMLAAALALLGHRLLLHS